MRSSTTSGQIVGALDWEQACLCPAETDFAWWLATRRQMLEVNGLDLDPELPGFDSREQVIRRYEQMIGRRSSTCTGTRCSPWSGWAAASFAPRFLRASARATTSSPVRRFCPHGRFRPSVLAAAVRRKNPFGFQFDRAGGGTPGGMQESRGRQGQLQRWCALLLDGENRWGSCASRSTASG